MALSQLAQMIIDAADTACADFPLESEFFDQFNTRVLARTEIREESIAGAISEAFASGRWPYQHT
jgi:hypothetical protein